MELTRRQEAVLNAVVQEYVLTATPVPSEKIAGGLGLKVSPATVRNEMVELEEKGLLYHPHTSAGRIPSDTGYRYFIDHLMSEAALASGEKQMVWHQFHQIEAEVDEWGPLAASVTAQMARTAALVMKPHARETRFRRLELVSVRDDLVLVVLIMQSGVVQQRLFRLDQPVDRDGLVKMANKLSALLADRTGTEIARRVSRLAGLELEIALLVSRLMQQSQRNWSDNVYYEGIGYVSVEPEFGRTEQLVSLMDALRMGFPLVPLLADVLESGNLRVVVGSENQAAEMRGCSLVLHRYGLSGQAEGVVGVVGPTRMRYWRAASLVRFMADLLDRLVEQSVR